MVNDDRMRQVQAVLGARGEAAVGTFVDGLGHLLAKARAGDRGSRQALRSLRAHLRDLDELLTVTLPGEN